MRVCQEGVTRYASGGSEPGMTGPVEPTHADPAPSGAVNTRRLAFNRLWPTLLTAGMLASGGLGLLFLPALAGSAPLLLIAMRPTLSVLLLVGGDVPFLPALLVATVFRALLDIGYFGLARYNMRSLLLRRVGTGRVVAGLSRRWAQGGLLWFCLVHTNLAVDVALGAGSVTMRRFLRFVIPGSAISSALYLSAGGAIAPWTQSLIRWMDAHASMLILGGMALAAAQAVAVLVVRRLRAARQSRAAELAWEAAAPGDSAAKCGTKGHTDPSGHPGT